MSTEKMRYWLARPDEAEAYWRRWHSGVDLGQPVLKPTLQGLKNARIELDRAIEALDE